MIAVRYVTYMTAQFWRAVLHGVATGFYSVAGALEAIAYRQAYAIDETHPQVQKQSAEPRPGSVLDQSGLN